MNKFIYIYLVLLIFVGCNNQPKKTGSSTVNGQILSRGCNPQPVANRGPQSAGPPFAGIDELLVKITDHLDLKSDVSKDIVFNFLTSKTYTFVDHHAVTKPKPLLNLIPHFQLCCEQELAQSQYRSFGTCLDRIIPRVLNRAEILDKEEKSENKLMFLAKGILLELSVKGRKGWCQYINYQWEDFKTPR